MKHASWKSETIQLDASTRVDVKANAQGVVLAQGDDVWFHDVHLTAEQACSIGCALNQGAMYSLQAQLESKA